MTWYEFWLFLHVTAVIVWIGGERRFESSRYSPACR